MFGKTWVLAILILAYFNDIDFNDIDLFNLLNFCKESYIMLSDVLHPHDLLRLYAPNLPNLRTEFTISDRRIHYTSPVDSSEFGGAEVDTRRIHLSPALIPSAGKLLRLAPFN